MSAQRLAVEEKDSEHSERVCYHETSFWKYLESGGVLRWTKW